jgi:thioredoxin-related protein
VIIKIFGQPDCPGCPPAKKLAKEIEKLKISKTKVEYWNTRTVKGMAEGAFYQVMSTPTILLTDDQGKILKEWRGKTPTLKLIKKELGF